VITVFGLASMLMVFESVRQFGTAIIASAGVAGIIVGFAAQKSIATLLAGFQIAMTQPIRIDDVVIVENEWGRIEEITLTYVVVRIWDLRRLILPITYFIETPFQNWTRQSADILGTVFLHTDYNVPLDKLRSEFKRVLEASPLWDKKVCVLQVTDSNERTLEIRALASARDASAAWDLRCEVREKLVTYLQRNYPESLPRIRAAVEDKAA
jgi:small-conductance mechanosensitive channel